MPLALFEHCVCAYVPIFFLSSLKMVSLLNVPWSNKNNGCLDFFSVSKLTAHESDGVSVGGVRESEVALRARERSDSPL